MTLTSPQIISPIDIATNGMLATVAIDRTQSGGAQALLTPALTIATMGWIVFLEEEIEEFIKTSGKVGRPKRGPKEKRKKITAWVEVDGVVYKEVAYTGNLNLSLTNVNVEVTLDEEHKPKLKILLPEIKTDE